ncbi:MAG: lysophospholipid acyltransferase family protein [Elusimicrobiota bacterium]|jgi:KDO2-lipid IV(A) lauroyltransferase|nr:lysophospholipid acyltransferase family protein [Elusimicrobiota bacterium]
MTRGKIQDFIEYYGIKMLMSFIRLFPMSLAIKIGEILAVFVYYFIPIRRKYVIEALSLSFPQKTKKEIKSIIKAMHKNLARTMTTLVFIPAMSDEKIKDMMKVDESVLAETFKKGKGAVIMSAHFGNWELTALSLAKRYPLSVIVAKQSNHHIDKVMNEMRTKKGYDIISRDDKYAARKVLKVLKQNHFVALLADQNESKNGVYVPFFGRLCSMPRGGAVFALRAECPLFTAFGVHKEDGSMEIELKEIPLPHSGDVLDDVKTINTIYSQQLEEVVGKYPEQWLWFHKKWKTRPKASRYA